ncbi:MAG TPA: methylmalonyl Co-A mutase-associated GTPase MeaB [Casimicrobiaceae bacterium]|nr:methylmalonyl Co-A mutase-associated GTPase MeaB [Casimicrobiaceae bacterium]
MAYVASHELVPRVLAGDVRAIARLLTRAESGVAEARPALDALFARAGKAHVVGITGVPGSGKSTLVARLAAEVRRSGRRIAIVAIDPSSPFSGGAILGDRIRMGDLGGDPGVFVRSMATRGSLGGLARGTLEAVDVLDAAGYDMVMIETVGVGQDEVDVARAAHTTVVVSAPGLGDDIQAIKAGILEIADVHVVSKCDNPESNRTIADLKGMLGLGLAIGHASAWRAPIVPTSALRQEGIGDVLAAIDRHRASLDETGEIERRRAQIAERRLLKAGEDLLRERFERERTGHLQTLLEEIGRRVLSPHSAALRLLAGHSFGGDA